MAYFSRSFQAKNGFLSTVLNEIDLGNVTHLSTGGFDDDVFLREMVSIFRNLRSIAFHGTKIEDVNVWLESIEAGRIKDISVCRLQPDAMRNYKRFSRIGSSGFHKFLMMLRKHGTSLRTFEIKAIKNADLLVENIFEFNQRIINTLSEFASNLETLKLYSNVFFSV